MSGATRTSTLSQPEKIGEHVRLAIEGMSCASCVRHVEKALKGLEGVYEAQVNLATNRADVYFNGMQANIAIMQQVLAKRGYQAKPIQPNQIAKNENEASEQLLRQVFIASILTLPVFVVEMGGHFIPSFHHWLQDSFGQTSLRVFQFILASLVLAGPGARFFKAGIPALLRGTPDMNALVAVGAFAAWGYSSIATFAPFLLPAQANHVYFEAGAVIFTLILLGRALEARARGRTAEAIYALSALAPKTARVIRAGKSQDIGLEEVQIGDILMVRPGEKLPVDGVVIAGSAFIDESMISGEPLPVRKNQGENIFGGTVNGTGTFTYRAEKIGSDTLLARIQAMVEGAQSAKLPIEALVDKVTSYFVPAVFAIAILTFIVWLTFAGTAALGEALVASVAVLIIACPCAMGLATPTSIMVATGRAAGLGILFRRGDALQQLKDTKLIAFDKTGTLTQGMPKLAHFETTAEFEKNKVLTYVYALESRSEHPLALIFKEIAKEYELEEGEVENFSAHAGIGVSGEVDGHKIAIGAAHYMAEIGVDAKIFDHMAHQFAAAGTSFFYAAINGKIAAIFAVGDPLKREANATIAALHDMGVQTAIISGDNVHTVEAIAKNLKIDEVNAGILPQGKLDLVRTYQEQGRQVAFVGDGINDAPALAAADVGIAIGNGTDVAIESADVVLMTGNLAAVVNAVAISRATIANIKQNLFWAFFYNIALIPVAAGVFYPLYGWQLSPMLSALAMAFSSVFVVLNALRLRRFQPIGLCLS